MEEEITITGSISGSEEAVEATLLLVEVMWDIRGWITRTPTTDVEVARVHPLSTPLKRSVKPWLTKAAELWLFFRNG